MVWFDGTWDRKVWTSDDGKELEDYTRSLQPSVILDNRSGYLPPQRKLDIAVANSYGYVFAGDYISPEGEVPATGLPGIDWETCQTMQLPNNWGYNRLVGFRPFNDLLRQLIDVTSKGGNMLLNIGPTAEGEILPQARQCLEKFAAWMKINSEAIHGTTASPFESLPFRRAMHSEARQAVPARLRLAQERQAARAGHKQGKARLLVSQSDRRNLLRPAASGAWNYPSPPLLRIPSPASWWWRLKACRS